MYTVDVAAPLVCIGMYPCQLGSVPRDNQRQFGGRRDINTVAIPVEPETELMPASRRSVLAAAGAALASFDAAATGANETIQELIKLSEASNATLMRGDIEKYQTLISFTDDFTLMAPFGGKPTRRADITDETMKAMGRFFKNGALTQEVIAAYGSSDMVVLALIERAHVEVGGLPPQPWALRVTLVYRREGTGWRLAHRHADPLVTGISLEQAAALAKTI